MSQLFSDNFATGKVMSTGRRNFLIGSVMAAGLAWAQAPKRDRFEQAKLDRIGGMTLSFNGVLKSDRYPNDPKRTLDILDAPQMIAARSGVHHVEFQLTHFASSEPPYLPELRGPLKRAKSFLTHICL